MHSLSDRQMGLAQKARFLQVPPAAPQTRAAFIFKKKLSGQPGHTYAPRKISAPADDSARHVTDRVDSGFAQLTQKAQNSPPAFIVCMFSYSDVLLNLC